jgi:myosin-crossreactive antigen
MPAQNITILESQDIEEGALDGAGNAEKDFIVEDTACVTFTDSAWLMSTTVNRQPHFLDQPTDVIVPWVYGLLGSKKQVPDIYPGHYDTHRLLRATRTLNNDEAFLGEGLLRLFLEGIYCENILLPSLDEISADLKGSGMLDQQLTNLRGLVEDKYSLVTAKE